jgi:hypothetical protein
VEPCLPYDPWVPPKGVVVESSFSQAFIFLDLATSLPHLFLRLTDCQNIPYFVGQGLVKSFRYFFLELKKNIKINALRWSCKKGSALAYPLLPRLEQQEEVQM